MTTTQIAWPLQVVPSRAGGNVFAEVETDSDAEVIRSAGVAAETRPNQLEWAPEYGTPTGLASTDGDDFAERLEQALRANEPRLPAEFHVRDTTTAADGPREVHLTAGITSIPVTL